MHGNKQGELCFDLAMEPLKANRIPSSMFLHGCLVEEINKIKVEEEGFYIRVPA